MKAMLKTDTDWISFIREWGMQYKNAKHILTYLNTYPEVLNDLRFGEIHNRYSLDEAQNEWIWLCSELDNPIEIDFFKPFWIPIEMNSYDHFIDISDPRYPIFKIHYFFFEPYRWYKHFIVRDIKEILLAPDLNIDLKMMRYENDKIRWEQVDEYFKERRRLGYEGEIDVKPVTREELKIENRHSPFINVDTNKSIVEVYEVSSLIAAILPFNLRINLTLLNYKYGTTGESIHKVKIIRDLAFFLREIGLRRIDCFRIDFPDSINCFLHYENEYCVLHHSNKNSLNEFVDAFNKLMKLE
jgi:hypothetical protein